MANEFETTVERAIHKQISINSEGLKNELSWDQTFQSPLTLTDTISLSATSTSGTVKYYAATTFSKYTETLSTSISEKINTLDIDDIYSNYIYAPIYTKESSLQINFGGLGLDGTSVSFNEEGSYNIFALSPSTSIYSKSEIISKTIYVTDGVARHSLNLKKYRSNAKDLEIISPTPTVFDDSGRPLFKAYEKITVKAIPNEGRIITGIDYIDNGPYTYNHYTFDKENAYFQGRAISADTFEIEIKPVGGPVSLYPIFKDVAAPTLSWVQDIGETIMIGRSLELDLRNTTTGGIFGPYGLTIESSDTDVLSVTNKTTWDRRSSSYIYDRKIVGVSEGTVTISAYEDNFPDYKIEKTIEVIPFSKQDIAPVGDHKIFIRKVFPYSDPCSFKTRYTEIDHIPFIPWITVGDPSAYISNIQLGAGKAWVGRTYLFARDMLEYDSEITQYSYNRYPPIYFYNDQSKPADALDSVTKISAGAVHSLFLQSGGESWGSGDELAAGLPTETAHTPHEAIRHESSGNGWYYENDLVKDVIDVSAGYKHGFLIKNDGSVLGFGYNDKAQLGIDKQSWLDKGELVSVLIDNVKSAVGGFYYHSLFLKNDNTVWACGDNTFGQLGDGTNTMQKTPVQVMSDVSAISAGGYYSLFLKNDGSVWAVGQNATGQLGDGTFDNRNTPIQIISSGITQVSANSAGNHSLFLKQDGTVLATGHNRDRQLGVQASDNSDVNTPSPVVDSSGAVFNNVQSISAGSNYSMFLRNDGNAWCVGGGGSNHTKLGADTDTYNGETHVRQTVFSNVAQISAGNTHTLFLLNDQTVYAVGEGGYAKPQDGGHQIAINGSGKGAVYLCYPGISYDKQGLKSKITISDELKSQYYASGSFEALPPSTDSCDEYISDLINTGYSTSEYAAQMAPIYISPNALFFTSHDTQYHVAKKFYDEPPASVSGHINISGDDLNNAVSKPIGSYNVQKKYILGLNAKVNNSSASWSDGLTSDGKSNYYIPEGLTVSGMDYMIQESDKKIWIVFTPGATISLNWPTTSKVGSPDDSTIYNFSHWDVYGGLNSVLHVDGMPYQPANQVDYVASILNGGANNSNLEITLPDYMESARVTITAHFVS